MWNRKTTSRWQVGDGRDINVWDAAWLPGSGTGYVMTMRGDYPDVTIVADLIQVHDNPPWWNVELVRSTFMPQEASIIENIPLSWVGLKDNIRWRWCEDGKFTMCSFYSQLQGKRLMTRASSSSEPPWKKVWGLRIPNKIKHFLFRALNNTLPCRRNLVRRGVIMPGDCRLCAVQGFSGGNDWPHFPSLQLVTTLLVLVLPLSSFVWTPTVSGMALWFVVVFSGRDLC